MAPNFGFRSPAKFGHTELRSGNMAANTIAGLRVVGTANELDEHGSTTTFYRVRSTEAGTTSSSLKTYLDFKRLHGALLDESSSHTPEPLPPCEQPLQTLSVASRRNKSLAAKIVATLLCEHLHVTWRNHLHNNSLQLT